MEYVNYYNLISVDSITLNNPRYHDIRCYYRLFSTLGRYYNTCIMQFNRVEGWAVHQKQLGTRKTTPDESLSAVQIFSDMHFLLIAMEKCYKLEAQLYDLLFGSVKRSAFINSKEVDDVRIMRNALEHMEEYMNTDQLNQKYLLPADYQQNGWSWFEFQMLNLQKGVWQIKDKKMKFSKTMFDHIYIHMKVIASEIQKRIDIIKH